MPSALWFSNNDDPVRTLIRSFLAWKTLLLVIAVASPGPGYDTSSSLIHQASRRGQDAALPPVLHYLGEKLTRWDAIYFVQTAKRGYLFEQEWAFGWGFSRIIAWATAGLGIFGVPHYEGVEALVAVLIAHSAHLLSVLVLYSLSLAVFPSRSSAFALTAAFLHIISPAGLFLSAPYAESSCAFLTFSGILLFARSFVRKGQPTLKHDLLILGSGLLFGIASTFRSNSISSGLLLLEEAFRILLSLRHDFHLITIRRLLITGLGGISVGAGFLLPQYIAYSEYCHQPDAQESRPWCQRTIPAIYPFVQDHYWNNGLFRYWTLSNIPLFVLATPMLSVMAISGWWGLKQKSTGGSGSPKEVSEKVAEPEAFPILRNLAASQLMLTLLTLTRAHVQIISRISSAYPVWLWYLAEMSGGGSTTSVRCFVRFMVIYAMVQGGLFASFLPPA